MYGIQDKINQILRGAETIRKNQSMLTAQSDSVELYNALCKATKEVAMLREENAELKQGKVFVDPKWLYDLETQLAKAHEELCQAGLREYGN